MSSSGPSAVQHGPTLPVPCRFGRYRMTKLLAVGGMAQIYLAKAFGAEGFVKPLVIKRLDPQRAKNAHFTQLFINEAKLLVNLSHGNIVPVFDFGRIDEDLYIAMEHVSGAALNQVLLFLRENGQVIEPQIAAYITAEICKGLDYAHRKTDGSGRPAGIIHRDIKPNNILISFEGEVKIVDFGVAKLIDRIESRLHLAGTLAYMSPEQAERHTVDPRTDIFSSGLVLYELLANQRAYSETSPKELLARARTASVPPLPQDVPEALQEIVQKATAHDPKERFSTAHEMEQSLSEFLITARSSGTAIDKLTPASRLAALMRRLPFKDEAALDEADATVPNEPGHELLAFQEGEEADSKKSAPWSGGDPDLGMIHDAAETFHSEFMTRVLLEQQKAPFFTKKRFGVFAFACVLLFSGIFIFVSSANNEQHPLKAVEKMDAGKKRMAPQDLNHSLPSSSSDSFEAKAPPKKGGSGHEKKAPSFSPTVLTLKKNKKRSESRRVQYGFLNLNSIPWSKVTIDGHPLKRPTPILKLKLKAGKHSLVLENPNLNLRKTIHVKIQPGMTEWKVVRLR